jgi:hypothetical protein
MIMFFSGLSSICQHPAGNKRLQWRSACTDAALQPPFWDEQKSIRIASIFLALRGARTSESAQPGRDLRASEAYNPDLLKSLEQSSDD